MVKALKAPRKPRAADRAQQRNVQSPPKPATSPDGQPVITLPPMSLGVVNLILEALGKLPMDRVEQVVQVLRNETQQQLQAFQQAATPAPDPAPAAPAP